MRDENGFLSVELKLFRLEMQKLFRRRMQMIVLFSLISALVLMLSFGWSLYQLGLKLDETHKILSSKLDEINEVFSDKADQIIDAVEKE